MGPADGRAHSPKSEVTENRKGEDRGKKEGKEKGKKMGNQESIPLIRNTASANDALGQD